MNKRSRKAQDNTMTYYIVIGGFIAICVIAVGYQVMYPKEIFMDKMVIDHNEFIVHNSQN